MLPWPLSAIVGLAMASSSSGSAPPAKRAKLLSELTAHGGCTRTALAKILSTLHKEGALHGTLGEGAERTIRSHIQYAIEDGAQANTPYGPLIVSMNTGPADVPDLEYVNPLAYLHVMCARSESFFELFKCKQGVDRKVVIYIDEICPGNPLRPDKSRTTQAVYWTIADFPGNILVQSGMWFLFSVVRTKIMCTLPGSVSGYMRNVLKIFFGNGAFNFQRGVILSHGDRSVLMRGCFSGFIADEKALKEIFSLKGASGSKPCMKCQNVSHRMKPSDRVGTSLVSIACRQPHLLHYHTNDSIYQIVDELRRRKPLSTVAEMARLEQIFGIHYDEDSLLFDDELRGIVKPVDHYVRDWMHTMVSHGLVGTQVARLLARLKANGIRSESVGEYARQFHLPKVRGKVQADWFAEHRVCADHLRTFASEQLNMLPIIQAFLEDVVMPTGTLTDHITCFTMLHRIVQVFALGPLGAMRYVDTLPQLIIDHGVLYDKLYPTMVKPKFHQLLHIPEDMQSLGALLSCFPTERKHRTVKSSALHIFRHFEHTVLRDLVNQQLIKIGDDSFYTDISLVNAQRCDIGEGVSRSTVATLPCGGVHAGDIVVCTSQNVVEVTGFWQQEDNVVIQGLLLQKMCDGTWSKLSQVSFIEASCIVSPVAWAELRKGCYRLCLPTVW